ncbi:MAG TPA: type VI secretion system baseplate subunit TssF [Acidobacteriaceae bacterium]|jgi:type VI secretion system protein ImpG
MRQRLLEVYERELGYLRQMGDEFGRKYPAVAGRLMLEPDRCGDPHVERLLEAFSFLAARIHLRLDDDLPELTEGFLDVVYPHYLRPIPAMSVAEFKLDDNFTSASSSVNVPAGSELRSRRTVDGMPCRFRTGYPVDLWPLEVAECTWRRPEQTPTPTRVSDAVAVVRVVLKGRKDVVFSKLSLDRLNFYLAGDKSLVLPLYELLSRNLIQVLVRNPKAPQASMVALGAEALRPVGFASDESLLQYTPRSFQGYRLLQEYFSFPEKFLFFALEGLQQAISAMQSEELELLFYLSAFDQPERSQALEVGVSAQTMRLGCTPIVNLFAQTAEPILVTQARHEYPIIPNTRQQRMIETYSIESVTATNPSRRSSVSIRPLFEHRFDPLPDETHIFWKASRRQSPVDERRPSDMYVSIVDRDGVMTEPNAEILTVRCTCTNHDLPSKLTFGDEHGDFELESGAGVGSIRALHRPTTTYAPPAGAGQVWQLISQLSLNHLSLGETGLPALQEILRIHNFTGAPHLDKQINGILSMQSRRHIALMESEFGSVAARGTRVEIELDESHFAGGGAYLFSAVMDRFLGLYVSMNSFSQLSVRTNARKEVLSEWPPRTGSQVVM